MRTHRLGTAGPELSAVGLGCNNFGRNLDAEASAAVINAAIDAGITHLDTAEMYGGTKSEEYIGATLGSRRDQVVIATKFLPRPADEPYAPGALRQRITDACEGSLRRLRTDRIDLYYQHYPDPDAPADEALETLQTLIQQGKVLHIASSNVSAAQIAESASVAAATGYPAFCGTQLEWSLLVRDNERDVIPAARAAGLGIVPYFPLAGGMLTGKYKRGEAYPQGSRLATMKRFADRFGGEDKLARVEELTAFARDHGHTIAELAVAWLLAQDGVASVIAGATTPEQVRANAAAGQWELSPEQLAAVPG